MLTIEQFPNRDHPNIIRFISDSSEKQRHVFFGGRLLCGSRANIFCTEERIPSSGAHYR